MNPCAAGGLNHRGGESLILPASSHAGSIHSVEGVHAFLLLHAVSSALVAPGMQILLHGLANRHVFDLDLIAEADRRLRRRAAKILLRQIPFENRPRPLRFEWQNNV